MPTSSTQFEQVYLGDNVNTLLEISNYCTDAPIPHKSADTNLTVFAVGGGPVTETHIRGAKQSEITLQCLADPVLWSLIGKIIGSRTGSTFQGRIGNNAAPLPGDALFQGTYTLFSVAVNYKPNSPATLALVLKPTDGGAIAPGWAVN